ncbi:MAG: alanine racemase [Thermoanaerobaculia bacterium]
MTRPTRAVVDLDAIAGNLRVLRERAGGADVIPVVKGDAYGHGAVPVARRLGSEGARRFAVALLEEGLALREAGIAGEILLLSSGDPADFPLFSPARLTPSVHDLAQLRALGAAAAAARLAAPLGVHLELDTGMGRLGVRSEELPAVIEAFRSTPSLRLAGTFTQFASATEPELESTAVQIRNFRGGVAALRDGGVDPGLLHASNSAGTLAFGEARFDAVRPGIALYGIPPSESVGDRALRAALSLETAVLSVKTVPSQTPIGYGGTFVTSRTTRVAALPIGYHDGFRRSLSGEIAVLIRGGYAPVVGAVSMDLTLVDATDCGAEAGDRVILLGSDGAREIAAWDLARAARTIPYEIVCGISARVPRVYLP